MSRILRVLHVEDSERDAALLTRHLLLAGYDLTSLRVDTPEAMNAALETREWDVILCDFSMPHFNALAALALLQETGLDIPLIIISGTVGEDVAVEAMRAGANDYLMKDNLTRLIPTVERELHEAQSRRARRQAEEKLMQSRRQLAEAQQLAHVGSWNWDLESNTLTWSDEHYRIFGLRPREFTPNFEGVLEYVHPQDRDLVTRTVERSLNTLEPFSFHLRAIRADGEAKIIHYRGSLVADEEGRPVRMFGTAQDVTELKEAEQKIRQAEEKYRSIFENAVEGIFQSTPDGRLISANPAMARILGFESPEELMAERTDIGAQHYVDPNCREELLRTLAEQGVVVGFECEVYRKDRSVIWAIESIRAISDESGALLYYEGSLEEITERKTLEEQLRQSQKLEAIGQLAGGIAHDFNNLLTAITGYTELALRRLSAEDPIYHNLSEIRKAADRAASLTSQLLAFSRKQILQPKVINLNAIVSDVDRMLRRLIGEDINLLTKTEPELGSVKADPGQISQVIMNLAVNARDAMPGGGSLTIETSNVYLDVEYASRHVAVRPGHYVMLAVSDTGTGMDEKTRVRIFEPFFTTKEISKGTGLGLSTVYGIVKQSGGNVWVYSEVGHGTTFKIYLPRVDEGARENQSDALESEATHGDETVLIAEDDDSVRQLAREVLEMGGYTALEASNGGAASVVCEQHEGKIHLLLTDVVMPEMSGRHLSERLKELRPEMRVLFMSGYTSNAIVHHGMLDENTNFMQKPFSPDDLLKKIRQVLDS
jgi:two-component system cell cycle sensor histidine kinase/response regulator CckA